MRKRWVVLASRIIASSNYIGNYSRFSNQLLTYDTRRLVTLIARFTVLVSGFDTPNTMFSARNRTGDGAKVPSVQQLHEDSDFRLGPSSTGAIIL